MTKISQGREAGTGLKPDSTDRFCPGNGSGRPRTDTARGTVTKAQHSTEQTTDGLCRPVHRYGCVGPTGYATLKKSLPQGQEEQEMFMIDSNCTGDTGQSGTKPSWRRLACLLA